MQYQSCRMTRKQPIITLVLLLLLWMFELTYATVKGCLAKALAKQGKPSPDSFSEAYNTKIAAAGASWSCSSCAMFMSKASWLTWLLLLFFPVSHAWYSNQIRTCMRKKHDVSISVALLSIGFTVFGLLYAVLFITVSLTPLSCISCISLNSSEPFKKWSTACLLTAGKSIVLH